MKTESLKSEILNTTNLVTVTEKLVLETSTDIFQLKIYRRSWFGLGKKWKLKFRMWGFSGAAKEFLLSLNNWLEVL